MGRRASINTAPVSMTPKHTTGLVSSTSKAKRKRKMSKSKQTLQTSIAYELPCEVLQQVARTLEIDALLAMARVCGRWRDILNATPELWDCIRVPVHLAVRNARTDTHNATSGYGASARHTAVYQHSASCHGYQNDHFLKPGVRWHSHALTAHVPRTRTHAQSCARTQYRCWLAVAPPSRTRACRAREKKTLRHI